MYSPEIREDTQRIPPVFLGLAASWPLGDWHRHRKDVKVRPELVLNPVTYISWCSILSSGYWKFSKFKILLSVYVYFTGKKIFSKFPNLKLCYLIDKHFLMMKVTNCCGTGVNWADLVSVVCSVFLLQVTTQCPLTSSPSSSSSPSPHPWVSTGRVNQSPFLLNLTLRITLDPSL